MDGGMIALLPEDPTALVVDSKNAEPASEIHLTLVYLGDDLTGWDDAKQERFITHISNAVDGAGAIEARVMGHATFNPDGGPDGDRETCAVHLVGDSTELYPLHKTLADTSRALLGADFPQQHQPFLPHITAGYGLAAGDLTYTGPIVFNRLVVALAGRWAEISLVPPPGDEAIAPYARTAYAQGWAASGGPMTERVRAGCVAAVELAIINADQPGILEATMQLGKLEGTWAAVYARREALVAKHLPVVLAAWRRAAHMLNVNAAIDRYRQSLGVTEAVDIDNTDHRRMVANSIAQSVASAIAGPDALPADRETIVMAVADALRDAQAEGTAGAIVAGADQLGVAGTSFDLAFADAHQALGDLGNYWGQGSGWVDRMVSGTATDLGGRLSTLAADKASYDDMLTAAMDVIGGDDIRSVETILDLAMGQSFSRGALALYGREGVTQVDYVTAGGENVCPLCINAESGSPWDRTSAPVPPLHPYCRCNLQATNPMQGLTGLLTQYLAS